MQIIKGHNFLLDGGFWTHDAIAHGDVIGRINEPIIIGCENGLEYVPATIVYQKDEQGDRIYQGNLYKRDLVDYIRDIEKAEKIGLSDYVLYDPVSEYKIIGLPYRSSKIISSKQSLEEVLAGELLRATMRKNEKSIGLNKRKLRLRCQSYDLPMKSTM